MNQVNDGMGMQTDTSGQANDLDAVLAKIAEIARKSTDGSYIYRGEPEHFPKVSSSLYRQYEKIEEIELENLSIEIVQRDMLDAAKVYSSETDDLEILTQLQHYGGKTNLIDFTTDFLIAIFFACDGSPAKDGRVILLERTYELESIISEPRNPINRVTAQKSVFVRPPRGTVQPDEEVVIPSHLKQSFLEYLRSAHGISTESIHNDIFGFIRFQDLHRNAYTQFVIGVISHNRNEFEEAIDHYSRSIRLNSQAFYTYHNRGIVYRITKRPNSAIFDFDRAIQLNPRYAESYNGRAGAHSDKAEFEQAIKDYDIALELEPDLACYYNDRGVAYFQKGETRLAIDDYSRAIERDSQYTNAYYNRGEAWLCLAEWERARVDLTIARDRGINIASSFHNEFESVSHFEQKYSVEIPADLAEILGG